MAGATRTKVSAKATSIMTAMIGWGVLENEDDNVRVDALFLLRICLYSRLSKPNRNLLRTALNSLYTEIIEIDRVK